MSGETEKDVSGLTTDTLRLLMGAHVQRIDERFAAFLDTYRRDQEKSNEFRAALDDLGKAMATRRELESAVAATSQRIDGLSTQAAELRSRLDIGPAGLAPLQAYQQQQTGRQEGTRESRANIYAIVGLVATLLGIINVAAILIARAG